MDAGPLVAVLNRRDGHHERCVAVLRTLREPLRTAWPVLTEAMYLLRQSWQHQDRLWTMLREGFVVLLPLDADDLPHMYELMTRYRDLPMDLADAALVRVAERERISRVFTLDRRDFSVYRAEGLGALTVVP